MEVGELTTAEFDRCRLMDVDVRRGMQYEEAERLHAALSALGNDVQTIVDLLINPATTDGGGLVTYRQVIFRILAVAEETPAVMDFYLPQLMQVIIIWHAFACVLYLPVCQTPLLTASHSHLTILSPSSHPFGSPGTLTGGAIQNRHEPWKGGFAAAGTA
jgi:hypothetical protein